MKFVTLCLLVAFAAAWPAAHPLDGKWFGQVESDVGTVQIGLDVHEVDGKVGGAINTPHGDWPITSVSEDKGTFTIVFDNGEGSGKLIGRVEGKRFSGKWDNSPYATGTFDVVKK